MLREMFSLISYIISLYGFYLLQDWAVLDTILADSPILTIDKIYYLRQKWHNDRYTTSGAKYGDSTAINND
jgi:hypothetical protein